MHADHFNQSLWKRVREGLQKNPENYPHFVDKGGGHRMWISKGSSPHVDKKFPNLNIINFENVDKPKGGGSDNVDKVIL